MHDSTGSLRGSSDSRTETSSSTTNTIGAACGIFDDPDSAAHASIIPSPLIPLEWRDESIESKGRIESLKQSSITEWLEQARDGIDFFSLKSARNRVINSDGRFPFRCVWNGSLRDLYLSSTTTVTGGGIYFQNRLKMTCSGVKGLGVSALPSVAEFGYVPVYTPSEQLK